MGAGFLDFALGALGLMLIAEGLLPFFSPAAWRSAFERALRFSDGQLRFVGLFCMAAGLVLLFFALH